MSMKSGLRNQLAEKMAGEITLSDSPGHALKKWRMNFEIAPGILADRLGVSPSVISDYESGRRKSPGTAIVGKIVDTLLDMDEENELGYCRNCLKPLNLRGVHMALRTYGDAVCRCGTTFIKMSPRQLFHSRDCRQRTMGHL